jgi:phosphate transport system substrate-binding protein
VGRRLQQGDRRPRQLPVGRLGRGIKQIKSKTVDFGASDAPLKDEELAADGLIQFPMVIGGVVPVVNIAGVAPGKLRLNGQVLGDIYLAKITKWNDPAITALNPASPARRGDRRDPPRRRLGHQLQLHQLPLEGQRRVEGQGRRGHRGELADRRRRQGQRRRLAYVKQLPNSIGYVEYAYAKQNKMAYTLLQNQAGVFVAPDDATFKAAAANADWNKTFYQVLTGQPGKDSWPITAATFILMHKVQDKPANATNSLKFFDWAYREGDKSADDLDYVPMPDTVKQLVRKLWKDQLKDSGGKAIAAG